MTELREMEKVRDHIVKWLKNYAIDSGVKGFIVGVSGGIDSGVVSTLCAMTGLKVITLEMPIHQNESHATRAFHHVQWLKENFDNVEGRVTDLTETFDQFMNDNSPHLGGNRAMIQLAGANARSRMRMTNLYLIGQINGCLVAGTGNKVEDFGVGFYTKYGDGGVDLSPIADLMKSEVRELARVLGINQEIIDAVPSDGLWGDSRSDEDQIGASYPELEWAMKYHKKNFCDIDLGVHLYNGLTERQKEVINVYLRFNKANQHKMNPIPICSVSHLR